MKKTFLFICLLLATNLVVNAQIGYFFPKANSNYNSTTTPVFLKFNSIPTAKPEIHEAYLSINDEPKKPVKVNFSKNYQVLYIDYNSELTPKANIKVYVNGTYSTNTLDKIAFTHTWTFNTGLKALNYPGAEERYLAENPLSQNNAFGSNEINLQTNFINVDSDTTAIYNKILKHDSLPTITVNRYNNGQLEDGYYFICNNVSAADYKFSIMVINSDGEYIFYKQSNDRLLDFKQLPDGRYTYFNQGTGLYYLLNKNFVIEDSIGAVNGYVTDNHDLIIDKYGNYALMALDFQTIDMSQFVPNGKTNALVWGMVIQVFNPQKQLLFQWNSLNDIPVTHAKNVNLTSSSIDYIHSNALEWDSDSTILICNRHLNDIARISMISGNVVSRLGLNSSGNVYTFINDNEGFTYQHDIRKIGDDIYTIFDNGNFKPVQRSRVIEYKIDHLSRRAELMKEYRNDLTVFSAFMGSYQVLNNGNRLIGWGGTVNGTVPLLTEINEGGEKLLEMFLPPGNYGYRALKFKIPYLDSLRTNITNYKSISCLGKPITIEANNNKLFWPDGSIGTKSFNTSQKPLLGIVNNHGFLSFQELDLKITSPVINAPDTLVLCNYNQPTVSLTIDCNDTQIEWSTGSTTNSTEVKDIRNNFLRVSASKDGDKWTDSIYIFNVNPVEQKILGQKAKITPFGIYQYSVPFVPGNKYYWDAVNGNVINGHFNNASNVQWGESGRGTLYIYTTNKYGCTDTGMVETDNIIDLASGISTTNRLAVKIYPNPFKNELMISGPSEIAELTISDLSGKTLIKESSNTGAINTSELPAGIYLLNLKGQGGIQSTHKIVKQ